MSPQVYGAQRVGREIGAVVVRRRYLRIALQWRRVSMWFAEWGEKVLVEERKRGRDLDRWVDMWIDRLVEWIESSSSRMHNWLVKYLTRWRERGRSSGEKRNGSLSRKRKNSWISRWPDRWLLEEMHRRLWWNIANLVVVGREGVVLGLGWMAG